MKAPAGLQSILARIPWWLVILGMLGLILAGLGLTDEHYGNVFRAVAPGVIVTIRVTLIAYIGALALGTLLALGLVSQRRWLSELTRAYVELARGLPMLVLLYIIAFAVTPGTLEAYTRFRTAFSAGLLPEFTIRDFGFEARAISALMLAYAAFIAEIVRGGIKAVAKGQTEAAQALGLSRWRTMRLIVLPQAFKTMVPPLGNDLISMLKDSALVSAVGVADITQIGKTYSNATFTFFSTYAVVAFYYLIMTIGLSIGLRRLERWLRRNEGK